MSKGKKIAVAVLVLVLIGAGVLWKTKSRFEEEAVAAVRAAFASVEAPNKVSADSITADSMSRSLHIRGLRGEFRQGDSVVTSLTDSVDIEGLDLAAFSGTAGTRKLADKLVLSGMRLQGDGMDFAAERYEAKGIHGDPAQLAEAFKDSGAYLHTLALLRESPDEDTLNRFFGQLAESLAKLESLRLDRLDAVGYRLDMPIPDFGVLRFTMAESVTNDYSLRGAGKSHARDIRVSSGETSLGSVGRISMDSARWPDIADMLRVMATGDPDVLAEAMAGQKQEIRNLVMEDILVGSAIMPVRIKAVRQDMVAAGQETFNIRFSVDELSMLFADVVRLRPELSAAAAAMPEELLIDFALDVDAVQKSGQSQVMDVDLKKLGIKERSLGELALNARINDFDPDLGNGILHVIQLELADSGLVDSAVLIAEPGQDPREYRQARALQLRSQQEMLPPPVRNLSADVASLLESGGKLEITVRPERPMSFLELMMASSMDPGVLGIESRYTAP